MTTEPSLNDHPICVDCGVRHEPIDLEAAAAQFLEMQIRQAEKLARRLLVQFVVTALSFGALALACLYEQWGGEPTVINALLGVASGWTCGIYLSSIKAQSGVLRALRERRVLVVSLRPPGRERPGSD